ncbi:hypothetical protein [Pseudoalteromonas sp. R86517]|uniref:hypothetical protein n=1 Tax=Pseudoalteromonas sp. R86517 TaxID=3093857 RepID=UPI003670932D
MTFRYMSTLDTITLLDDLKKIISDNDHKINKLMLNNENPNFKGFWSIVEPHVFANKQLNYRGVKVLMYKLMVCIIKDIEQQVQAYPDYDDEFCEEFKNVYGDDPEEHFDSMITDEIEENFPDSYKEDIENEFPAEFEADYTHKYIRNFLDNRSDE